MPIPSDLRYAIASLTAFLDNWLYRPAFADHLVLRELHAARAVLTRAQQVIDEHDTPPPAYQLDPPAWFPSASMAHRLKARADARSQVRARPAPRMPHP